MKIHTLNTAQEKNTMNKFFEDLPDESAVTLIADRLDLAKNNNQPFTLEQFDFQRHQRGLCVGLTEGNTAIALFYVFENGLYTWAYRAHIHVIPERPTICWLRFPRFFVCQRAVFMLPVFPDVAC